MVQSHMREFTLDPLSESQSKYLIPTYNIPVLFNSKLMKNLAEMMGFNTIFGDSG